ncbi:MAG: replication factor C small subunit [Candidatus Aenigmarchaeota archaeon]|nr:replication factor C small subunit [Candidatus Aenigmarchaeota archaeon]
MFEEIWTEKYRPKKLEEMAGQNEIVNRLESFVKKRSLPHCLFAGPAGTGKTTAALCIARELFGENFKSNFLELNASDERGIDTIRTKVKDFARTRAIGDSFKIIYLDEADALTRDAQQALRRTMENFADTCRFILAANYSSKIILPIQSRCAVFRFSRLTKKEATEYLKKIQKAEKLKIDEKSLGLIFDISEGDMRKAINILQTAAISSKKITTKIILQTAGKAEPRQISDMLNLALKGKFTEARKILVDLLFEKGLSGEDIIKQIHKQIFSLQIPDKKKMELITKTGEYEFRLTEGSNELIQLEALLAQLGLIKS